jgi:hypothetical protein
VVQEPGDSSLEGASLEGASLRRQERWRARWRKGGLRACLLGEPSLPRLLMLQLRLLRLLLLLPLPPLHPACCRRAQRHEAALLPSH